MWTKLNKIDEIYKIVREKYGQNRTKTDKIMGQ